MIRKATPADAQAIQKLIHLHGEKGQMLERDISDVLAHIGDFFVCEKNGEVLGSCALNYQWDRIVEIRSLAVDPAHFGQKVASRLIQAGVDEARSSDKETIFVLTYAVSLFHKFGFEIVEKSTLPGKVWNDCQGCPKEENCDEIAMARPLHPILQEALESPGEMADKKLEFEMQAHQSL